jgi:GNAT superfamily N-acetyltransferase
MGNSKTAIMTAEPLDVGDEMAATIRPIAASDADALVRFHSRLSRRTVTLRYFYPHLDLGVEEVAHLTQVDGRDRVALVVARAGELIAVGRYERLDAPELAEVAFVVCDEFQRRGIATWLLQRLAVRAREVGITHFVAAVMGQNSEMLAVFHAAGFPTTSSFDYGTVELKMSIALVDGGLQNT